MQNGEVLTFDWCEPAWPCPGCVAVITGVAAKIRPVAWISRDLSQWPSLLRGTARVRGLAGDWCALIACDSDVRVDQGFLLMRASSFLRISVAQVLSLSGGSMRR